MDDERAWRLKLRLRVQSDVVRRAQLQELGYDDNDIRRLVRRRILARVHPGVYVGHTGPLSWEQRAWAAVLSCWPAALCGESARRAASLHARRGADDERPIEVVVSGGRHLHPPAGVVVRRSRVGTAGIDWSTYPPRQLPEEWVLDLAGRADREIDAVAVIADAVGARSVKAAVLATALQGRARSPRRSFLAAVITDAAAGSCSALEQRYLDRVERAHALPTADRQVRDSAKGTIYRDVEYRPYGLVVELDGRLGHVRVADRDRDLDRDLATVLTRRLTVRLGWGQVERACATAASVAVLLQERGWRGVPHRCARCR